MADAKKTTKKAEPRVLALKRKYLPTVSEWLALPMHGKEARSRNRFVRSLHAGIAQLEEDRLEIIKRFADLDANGELQVIDEEFAPNATRKVYKFKSAEERQKAEKEIDEMKEELFKLDITPANSDDFVLVRNLILDRVGAEFQFTFSETEVYDAACEAFENA